jgi:class 3 adenylate cyclase
MFAGLAQLQADGLGVKVRGLAAWDGSGAGTAQCISDWWQAGFQVDVIAPASGEFTEIDGCGGNFTEAEDLREGLVVRAMLFADVKGFSKLNEIELHVFMREFRGDLSKLVESRPEGCKMVSIWSDGLLMVFRDAVSAARMVLDFRDLVVGEDWEASGLGTQLGIRIGLHAGSVWAVAYDPLLDKPGFGGGNINHAARIEPITEVNQIYASDSLAALVRLAGDPGLRFVYMGSLPLVKRYGSQRLFRLDLVPGEIGGAR